MCEWPRGELNPQHPSTSGRVVCRLPTGPVVRRLVKEPSVADLLRSAECPAGVEPACPVWKTDAWAARPRAHGSAEGEGVEPSRLVARPGSGRVPSPVGLPFRLSVWMAGFE